MERTLLSRPPAIGIDTLRALTVSHRTAELRELERMALSPTAQSSLLRSLGGAGLEAVLLCTCNRTELYWRSRGPADDALAGATLRAGTPPDEDQRCRFTRVAGSAAATHLYRVAAGLESLVVGEAEVLGQVRAAVERARRAGTAGFFLSALFRAAVRFGGQARSETRIGHGALSVASAAVQLLTGVVGDRRRCTVVVVGAGATGLKAARHLRAEGVGRLVLVNRTLRRAQEAALDLEAEAAPLDTLPEWLTRADAVVAAVEVPEPLVTKGALGALLPARRGRPLALIDLSLPRALDPRCAALESVALHDLAGLQEIVTRNRALREAEIPRVERLLAREIAFFVSRLGGRVPLPPVPEPRPQGDVVYGAGARESHGA